jgi:hypothetical protein
MLTLQNVIFRTVTYENTRRHIPAHSTPDFSKCSYAKPGKKWEDNIKIDPMDIDSLICCRQK